MATARSPGPAVRTIDREVAGPVPDAGGTGSGSGATVKSVALSASPASVFNVSGSPITRSGTLALSLDDQAANLFLGGPASGAAAQPSFRQPLGSDILLDRIAGSTYSTLQHYVNTMTSPGTISGGGISTISSTQIRVAAGRGMIRVSDDDVSSLPFFDWAQTDFTIPADDQVRYLGAVYNSGSPIIEMRTAMNWNYDTEIPLGAVLRNTAGTIFATVTRPYRTADAMTNVIQRFDSIAPVQRDNAVGGLILGETGTRNVTLSAGKIWVRLNDFDQTAINTAVSGSFVTAYYNGTAWVYTPGATQWPNGQYNDITSGLVAITGNRYVNLWFYVGASGGGLRMVYGQAQHVLLADALAEAEPTFFPTNLHPFLLLVGKLTFQNGGSTATSIVSAFTGQGLGGAAGGAISDHNNLSNLQGGTTAQYYHLTNAAYGNISAGLTATPQFARMGLGAAADATYQLTMGGALINGIAEGLCLGTLSSIRNFAGTGSTVLSIKGATASAQVELSSGQASSDNVFTGGVAWSDPSSAVTEKRRAQIGSRLEGNTTTRGGNLVFFTSAEGDAGFSERVRITGAGRVGLLTNDPQYTLDVRGMIRSTDTVNVRTTTATDGYITLAQGSATTQGFIEWFKPGSPPARIAYLGFGFGALDDLELTIAAGNFKLPAGNMGIGRTPAVKLDVAGDIRTNANVSWDFGAVVTAASTFDTTRHVAVTIAGVAYKLALCT